MCSSQQPLLLRLQNNKKALTPVSEQDLFEVGVAGEKAVRAIIALAVADVEGEHLSAIEFFEL